MGQDLYEGSPAARAVFDQADRQLGFPLSSLCFSGPEAELVDTVNQQPALFTTSMAALAAMREQDWAKPDFVAGHSLGEFSALVAAGSLPFADALTLVQRRGELMKAAGEQEPGAMAALLALDVDTVQTLCAQATDSTGRPVQVANDNCPGQVVISGDKDALAKALELAAAAGARKIIRLPISIAAHSPLMASAAAAFAQLVDETAIETPQIPVIANVSARPLTAPDDIRSELKAQLTAAVAWTESMNYLCQNGVDTFVEAGSGEVLLGLIKRINRKTKRIKFKLAQ